MKIFIFSLPIRLMTEDLQQQSDWQEENIQIYVNFLCHRDLRNEVTYTKSNPIYFDSGSCGEVAKWGEAWSYKKVKWDANGLQGGIRGCPSSSLSPGCCIWNEHLTYLMKWSRGKLRRTFLLWLLCQMLRCPIWERYTIGGLCWEIIFLSNYTEKCKLKSHYVQNDIYVLKVLKSVPYKVVPKSGL